MKFLSVFLSVLQRSSRVPRGNRKSVRKCTELFISTSHKFKLVKHLIKLEHLSHCVCRTLSTLDHPFMRISGWILDQQVSFSHAGLIRKPPGLKSISKGKFIKPNINWQIHCYLCQYDVRCDYDIFMLSGEIEFVSTLVTVITLIALSANMKLIDFSLSPLLSKLIC